MSPLSTALILIALVALAYHLGLRKVPRRAVGAHMRSQASRGYFGAYVALWCGIPSFLMLLAWLILEPVIVDEIVVASLPEAFLEGKSASAIDLIKAQIHSLASGVRFSTPDPAVEQAAQYYNRLHSLSDMALFVVVMSIGISGLMFARSQISAYFGVRVHVEKITTAILIVCSTIAILTTIGILVSLLFESAKFFVAVPIYEFLFGLNWEPQIPIREGQVAASGAFGAIPVFTGTILISAVAMLIAIPVGLMAAIYMSEYASPRVRKTIKPVLEVLAGIPTIVYGFFAVLTIAPWMTRTAESMGFGMSPNSAFAAGFVMGIMITPFVSSLADDALTAVPNNLREGAAALGATKAETIKQVLLPAALPGIMGGVLLAVSRAIGETMIVVMAAGIAANLTANPFEAVTTVTVQIVTLLIGDTSFDNPKTLAAFALGLVLFLMTLALNILALRVTRKYREKYD